MPRFLALALLASATVLARPGPDTALAVEPAPRLVHAVEVRETPRCPPTFALTLRLSMPTPGWELGLDSLEGPDAEGRFVLRVTGTPPEGLVAQVVTPTPVQAELPTLRKGRYLVDVRFRADPAGKHERIDALVLNAR